MTPDFQQYMIAICENKIAQKWHNVGISFYVFFKNKNDNPLVLSAVAHRWITVNKFDHFEKAIKIKNILLQYSVD